MDTLKYSEIAVDTFIDTENFEQASFDWANLIVYILTGLFITIVGGIAVAIITGKFKINFKTLTIIIKSKDYVSKYSRGSFTFDYSNNNGTYVIGNGERTFTTKWSKASNISIHAYSDESDIDSIGLMKAIEDIGNIRCVDADFSSRVRTPHIGDVVIWKNHNGYYAATKIVRIQDDRRGDAVDELECEYIIYS